MIEIFPQILEIENEYAILKSRLVIDKKDHNLWYKFPVEYKEYLVTENMDAFLVGLIFLGLERKQDIILKGVISEKLYYSLTHYLIPALINANPEYGNINIYPNGLSKKDLNELAVSGTGLSCGIDSFATYYDHVEENGSFGIDYFTFFNVGAHGDLGGGHARDVYESRLNRVRSFANKVNKKLITVDSNLSEILQINFQKSHSLRNISCALHLQKLFRNYYYASAYKFDYFYLNANDTSDSDFLYLRLLDTESTSFYSSVAQYSRVERTLMISERPETFNYLDVCTNPWRGQNHIINCSSCYKCLRTQLTLEIAGKLHLYSKVFDLVRYKSLRNQYVGELLLKKNKTPLDLEVLDLIKTNKSIIDWKIYLAGFYSLGMQFYNLQKKYFKRLIKV